MARETAAGGRPSKRDDLLRAAMELFAKEGSRGTSLAAIASRIGVTTPAITHHFGTKQRLLLEIVAALDGADGARMGLTDGTGAEDFTVLRRWAARLEDDARFAASSRLRAVIVSEALDPEHPAHAHFVERHRAQRRALVGILRAGRRAGWVRADVDAKAVATEVLGFCQGIQFQWLLDPDDVALTSVVDAYLDRLEADLAP